MRHLIGKEFWAGLCLGFGAIAFIVASPAKARLYTEVRQGRSADQVKIGQDMRAAIW